MSLYLQMVQMTGYVLNCYIYITISRCIIITENSNSVCRNSFKDKIQPPPIITTAVILYQISHCQTSMDLHLL